jgi:hypothetical protein
MKDGGLRLSDSIKSYSGKYIGGHVEYPTSKDCKVFVYNDRIELHFWDGYVWKPTIIVRYQSMTNIESTNEDKISAFRVAMLGIVGGLWKKKHVYTVIQYNDQVGEKTIILDLGKQIDEVQPLIYHNMLEFRKKES